MTTAKTKSIRFNPAPSLRSKFYYGYRPDNTIEIFQFPAGSVPTVDSHPKMLGIVGPFKTRKELMARLGRARQSSEQSFRVQENPSEIIGGKSIQTEYFGPGNTRGARIKASVIDGNKIQKSISVVYPHELDMHAAHLFAAEQMRDKMGWKGDLVGVGSRKGFIWGFKSLSQTASVRRNPSRREQTVFSNGYAVARISRKNQYGEYVVRLVLNGVRMKDADYFTENFDDAQNTAQAMIDRWNDWQKNPTRKRSVRRRNPLKKMRRTLAGYIPLSKVLKGNPVRTKLKARARKPIFRNARNAERHERIVAAMDQLKNKKHVCITMDGKTVMQSKDTPAFRALAKRYAKTLARKHRGSVIKVVAY